MADHDAEYASELEQIDELLDGIKGAVQETAVMMAHKGLDNITLRDLATIRRLRQALVAAQLRFLDDSAQDLEQ